MVAGALEERVAFDAYVAAADDYGGQSYTWSEQFIARAQFVYHRGGEDVQQARLAGQSVFKVKIRSSAASRAVTSEYRLRDLRRGGVKYNVREVDAITDRAFVWLVVESGVQV